MAILNSTIASFIVYDTYCMFILRSVGLCVVNANVNFNKVIPVRLFGTTTWPHLKKISPLLYSNQNIYHNPIFSCIIFWTIQCSIFKFYCILCYLPPDNTVSNTYGRWPLTIYPSLCGCLTLAILLLLIFSARRSRLQSNSTTVAHNIQCILPQEMTNCE